MKIKFMWNGIKVDGKLYRCYYSNGKLIGYPDGTITIYAKDYKSLPLIEGFKTQNDTDLMTDYFEKDRIRVTTSNKYYPAVLAALKLREAHNAKMKHNRG